MSFININIHAVWAVKERKPLLTMDVRNIIFPWIFHESRAKNIYVDCINGYLDHVHCLISLKGDQNISKVIGQIKGGSAYHINRHELTAYPFQWQTEYYAASVSHDAIPTVRKYIKNQESHHRHMTFAREYESLTNGTITKMGDS